MTSREALTAKTASTRVLLSTLFDYAGLFPPASLPLADALAAYSAHRVHPDRWMLGPFVIPTGKLEALVPHHTLFSETDPWNFSCLGSPVSNLTDLTESIRSDFDRIQSFERRLMGAAKVVMYETRVPLRDGDTDDELDAFSRILADLQHESAIRVFLEVARGDHLDARVKTMSDVLSRAGTLATTGLKMRCGGMSDADFPKAEELAVFLHEVTRHQLRYKLTAGLHHPIRYFNPGQHVMMHGFLNVFFAATFARSLDLHPSDLTPLILDEDPAGFVFTESGIRWRHYVASTEDVQQTRNQFATSIGSCSFDEPRSDLIDLGILSR